MGPQKETIMALKVDLACNRCYRKVKKLLCQFPQIHDQIYNEKQNTVMIKVICCSPEKIRDNLCCKGGKSIQSIEILQPPPPKKPPPPAEKPPEKPADKPPPPPAEKPPKQDPPPQQPAPPPPPADPKPPEKPKEPPVKPGPPPVEAPPQKPKEPEPPKPDPKPAEPAPVPIQCYPVQQVNPPNTCCPECYQGQTNGPCYHGYGYGYGYGVPPPPPPPASGWGYFSDCCEPPPCGYGDYYNYNKYKPGYCVTRCGDYISDENPTACVIM